MSALSPAATLAAELPALQPEDPAGRLLLFGIRQMGGQGLADASAANAFLTAFGRGFRRPLVLLRTLMADIAALSTNPIRIAPWCCPRMTRAEASLLAVLRRVQSNPDAAAVLLADLLGRRDVSGVLAIAHALTESFADLALPLDA